MQCALGRWRAMFITVSSRTTMSFAEAITPEMT
jgi:hypothetical protein